MKTTIKFLHLMILTLCISCGGDDNSDDLVTDDDGGMDELTLVGIWETSSGTFLGETQTEYLIFEEDNTLDALFEDDLGFRNSDGGIYSQGDSQLTIDFGFGLTLSNYTLSETTLTITDSDNNTASFNRVNTGPTAENWTTALGILDQGDAPFNEEADIAFRYDHSQILLGNGYETDDIALINPNSFSSEGVLATTESAFAVEVEKININRYIFQSNNGFSTFTAFSENTGAEIFTSIELGPWIYGLASVDSQHIWASSGNEQTLYLLDYSDTSNQVIERSIPVGRRVEGMDYQNGFLYICSRGTIYKCDVSTDFEVIESYTLEGYSAYGIAFDGTNFWINAAPHTSGSHQLIKTNLTL